MKKLFNLNVNNKFSNLLLKGLLYSFMLTLFIMILVYLGFKNINEIIDFLIAVRDKSIAPMRLTVIFFPLVLIIINLPIVALLADIASDLLKNKK